MSLIVFAFHYNRGRFLENLVRSVVRHLDCPLVIVDDGSTEPESLRILERLGLAHEVVRPGIRPTNDVTGGLHANMRYALEIAVSRGAEFALMIQDDMQLIRDITLADLDTLRAGFARPNASFVIHCSFMKANYGSRVDDGYMIEAAPGIYERNIDEVSAASRQKATSYSDTGFFSIALYQQYGLELVSGEDANQVAARSKGLRLGFMLNPVMHWLPMPTSFHRRRRSWTSRAIDHLAGAGVHSIEIAADNKVRAQDSYRAESVPYAEDRLSSPTLPSVRYWSLHGGLDNLRSRAGWRGVLGDFMVRIRNQVR